MSETDQPTEPVGLLPTGEAPPGYVVRKGVVMKIAPKRVPAPPKPPRMPTARGLLTDREFEVAYRLATGAKNREIAEAMGISVKTVDVHRANLLKKLACRNNVELALRMIREGAVTP